MFSVGCSLVEGDADAAQNEEAADADADDGDADGDESVAAADNTKPVQPKKKKLEQIWYYPYDGVETVIHGCRQLHTNQSKYQKVEIMDSPSFGRMLLLDDIVMSAEKDEYIYHESLVHPAMMAAGPDRPKHVMIAGGGELSTAREVLKHKSVERVTLVDIDGAVVNAARSHLAEWGNTKQYLDDPRLSIVIDDAFAWLKAYSGPALDVVIMDISDPDFGMSTEKEPHEKHFGSGGLKPGEFDPYEAPKFGPPDAEIVGPTHPIYRSEFFQLIKKNLSPTGIVVTQSTSSTDVSFVWLYQTMCIEFGGRASACSNVHPYTAHIPSFTALWSFILVSNSLTDSPPDALLPHTTIADWPIASVDAAIADRTATPATVTAPINALPPHNELLRWYDGTAHRHMFALPKTMRRKMKRVTVDSDFAPLSVKAENNKRVWEY